MQKMTIYEALSAASTLIAAKGVGKTGKYNDGKASWSFREYDKIMLAVTSAMNETGLSIVPFVESEILEERVRKTSYGDNIRYYARVRVRYTVYASDGSHVESVMIGEGLDSGDKAINKALTAAHKYLCMQLFSIPVEGAPENEHTVPDAPAAPKKSATRESASQAKKKPVEDEDPGLTVDQFKTAVAETGFIYEVIEQFLTRRGGEGIAQRNDLGRANVLAWAKTEVGQAALKRFVSESNK